MAAQFMTGGGGEPDDIEGNVDDDDDDSEGNKLSLHPGWIPRNYKTIIFKS